jgi:hypothetical protein
VFPQEEEVCDEAGGFSRDLFRRFRSKDEETEYENENRMHKED